jgi:hypothetical protein
VELAQERRELGVAATDEPEPTLRQRREVPTSVEAPPEPLEPPLARLLDDVLAGLGGERCESQLAQGVPSSVGERYESASAR